MNRPGILGTSSRANRGRDRNQQSNAQAALCTAPVRVTNVTAGGDEVVVEFDQPVVLRRLPIGYKMRGSPPTSADLIEPTKVHLMYPAGVGPGAKLVIEFGDDAIAGYGGEAVGPQTFDLSPAAEVAEPLTINEKKAA